MQPMQRMMPGEMSGDSAAGPQEGQDAGANGYEICIAVKPDGTFNVYKEDAKAEMAEMPNGGGESSDQGESYDNPSDAFRAAFEILKSNHMGETEQDGFDAALPSKDKGGY